MVICCYSPDLSAILAVSNDDEIKKKKESRKNVWIHAEGQEMLCADDNNKFIVSFTCGWGKGAIYPLYFN